jgi:O-antigen/teichoic acid export membrane protein
MGLAWLGNMAFNTSDMLILGTFSDAKQVGLYSASYRILNQALMGYYLLTNVLYPQFARLDLVQRRRMLRPQIFLLLFGIGAALALLIGFFRSPLLRIVFGHPFLAAAPLLLLLAWCVPLDFIVSYLSNAYFAWGMERSVLICAAIAAAVNIALNLATIPRYGAMAAAINTLIAYLVYLGSLAWAGKRVIDSQQGATVANP